MSKHDKQKYRDMEAASTDVSLSDTEKKKKPFGLIAVAVLVPILGIYLGGAAFFSSNFVPNTTFDGKDFSFKKPELIAETMTEDTLSRSITLKEIEGEEKISLHEELDYVKSAVAPEKGWIEGVTSWTWPIYFFRQNELKGRVEVSYDKEKLDELIDELDAMDPDKMRKPTDASLERKGDVYEIVPEDPGNEIIRERLESALLDGIESNASEINLVEADCYTKPNVYRDDPKLTETLEKYKSVNFQRISIDMTGATEVLETPDVIGFYNDKGIDKEKIEEYVRDLQAKYDTYEESRYFVNSYGYEIEVGTRADTYGFLLNVDETVDKLYNLMKEKKSEEITPVWDSEGWTRLEDGSDIGSTYIEICLSDQRLWAYSGGSLVLSTDVVSGTLNKFDTPRGVFAILSKETDTHLKGQEKLPDGKIEKWDSFVNFWMALNWSGVGLHNAPWRGAFGGGIYQSNGSHGCVNMDYSSAQYLYNNFPHGTPVVIW